MSFLKREIKRGNKSKLLWIHQALVVVQNKWKFQDNIDELLSLSAQLDDPLCLIIILYTPNVNKHVSLHKHFIQLI